MPAGLTWRFREQSSTGTTYLDDYREYAAPAPSTPGVLRGAQFSVIAISAAGDLLAQFSVIAWPWYA
jgi:hypothetical protein